MNKYDEYFQNAAETMELANRASGDKGRLVRAESASIWQAGSVA
jgi:hypothetical protein